MIAYLDPATGSMILSALAGGIAGVAVFFKTFGHRAWSRVAFWKKAEAPLVESVESVGSAGNMVEEPTDVGS